MRSLAMPAAKKSAGTTHEADSSPDEPVSRSSSRGAELRLGSLSLLDQIVVSATNFLTMALVARTCSAAEVGVFALVRSVLDYARTIQERMLAAPYLVFAQEDDRDQQTLLGSNLVHQGFFAAAGVILVLLAGYVVGRTGNPPGAAPVMIALAVGLPGMLFRDQLRAICGAHFRFDQGLRLDLWAGIGQLGLIGGLAACQKLNPLTAIAALGVACVVPVIIGLRSTPVVAKISRERLLPDWIATWDFARWLLLARAIGIGGFFLIPWMVAWRLDAAATGTYAACASLVGLSLMFVMGVNNYFQPRTVRAYREQGTAGMLRIIRNTILVLGLFLACVCVGFWFLGGWLLGLVYHPRYVEAGGIAFWLSVSTLAVSVSIACGNGLAALRAPKSFVWGEFSYLLVSVGLAWKLIPLYQLHGAAWALVGGGIAASLVTSLTLFGQIRRVQENS